MAHSLEPCICALADLHHFFARDAHLYDSNVHGILGGDRAGVGIEDLKIPRRIGLHSSLVYVVLPEELAPDRRTVVCMWIFSFRRCSSMNVLQIAESAIATILAAHYTAAYLWELYVRSIPEVILGVLQAVVAAASDMSISAWRIQLDITF